MTPEPPPRLVVLRALGLGDLLTAVPALRALRRAFPAHQILLAAPPALAAPAAATGAVDRLVPATAPGRAVPETIPWSGRRPDLAVDLHGNGPESLRPLRALRPRRLIGYADPAGAPPWPEAEHERERWCRLLEFHGLPADPADLRIAPPAGPSPAPGAVVMHPGADAAARRWPADRFAAVGRALRRAGRAVVVTGGPEEGPLAARVAEGAGLPPTAAFAGTSALPFADLCALLAGARAVVAGDTGIAHLATALATPSVTLFGPVSPRLWGPPPSPAHRVLWHPDDPTDPRPGDAHGRDGPDERLLRIAASEVTEALAALPQRAPAVPA
ncbi:glycosyltransferase family 9 protein [Streptomyces sp. DSM 44917]|uniref:Glycosyltransferase family 9 protein n=1 Tax=Streptomyces boetiae TaxID=3075541 RepID=A0ABU2LDR7_9ACTN|nr:glycosyltransferase family 9 protein [Streptomyces sp. DSM 44917]MDT0309723.1 glycosyltransferase family 9 protein [Streptomyces sp. DSM 44917]